MKLYDLTTLCEEAAEEKCQNPFTLPVAVLLYKYDSHSPPHLLDSVQSATNVLFTFISQGGQ